MKNTHHLLAAILALCAGTVAAQTLSGLKVLPAQVTLGEAVKATVAFDVTDGLNCGMRLNWGDGSFLESRINQAKDVPTVASHQYAKPGNYTVVAEPRKVGGSFKCAGKNQSVAVAVLAPAVAAPMVAAPVFVAPSPVPAPGGMRAPPPQAAAPAARANAIGVCPSGWLLTKAGIHKKTSAFTCTAKANTPIPEPKVLCPGDLTYFENMKKGQLGCRM